MPDNSNQIDLYGFLAAQLKGYVEQERHGQFSIAGDPFEVTELLGQAPGRFRCILLWQGEEPMGDPRRSGICQQTFLVVVSGNRGLQALKGANLSQRTPGAEPLMQLANDVRDFVRRLVVADERTSLIFEYAGCQPLSVDADGKSYLLDAYQMTFKITAALPLILEENPRPTPPVPFFDSATQTFDSEEAVFDEQ